VRPLWPLALLLALAGAALVAWPAVASWHDTIICGWVHPDCLGNHWLLAWVAERAAGLQSLVHNDRYYWPVGDAPWLAGNGSDGFLYLPWHFLLGWPRASTAHVVTILALDGLGAYALARALGASPWASLAAAPTAAMMVYGAHELGAGRFSQADFGFLAFFLAAWLKFCAEGTRRWALLAALALAATSALYWYYGFFGVLAGGTILLFRRPPAARLLEFAAAYLLLIGPLLYVFLSHYADIPGTTEDVFPHPEVAGDSCWPALPFLVGGGRHAGRALPLSTTLLAAAALFLRRDRLTLSLAAVSGLFAALMAGPLWPGGPYELVYGLAGPLRRFWWPYRHVVVVNLAWIALAAVATDALLRRVRYPRVLAALVAISIPIQLELFRAPYHATWSKAVVPTAFYTKLHGLPGDKLLEVPLTGGIAASQATLIYQFEHGKTLINGHALWVARVRPAAWDDFVAGNSFLAACQRLERGELGGSFAFDPADLRALVDQGLGVVTLNKEYFPVKLDGVVQAYDRVFTALFGEPAALGLRARAWDTTRYAGTSEVAVTPFTWPSDVQPGGPTLPVMSPRPPSMAFEMPGPPQSALPKKTAR